MTPKEKWDTVVVSGTIAGAFLLVILAVCYVIASIAEGLSEFGR